MAWIWDILIASGSLVLVAIIGFVVWYKWMTRTRWRQASSYEYVFINPDGSAREVTANEREYLETVFHPADGARPYIKFRYESVDGWKSLEGFLLRRQLPSEISVREPTEQEDQQVGG